MSPALLAAVATAPAVAQDCEAPYDVLVEARSAVLEADLTSAERALARMEPAYACTGRLVQVGDLAETFIVEGAMLSFAGDTAGAAEAFRAAGLVAPGRWIDELGPQLKATFDAAQDDAPQMGIIDLDPPLGYYTGAVDGEIVDFPAEVPIGIHLVQAGPNAAQLEFARIVVVFAGAPSIALTGHDGAP